MSKWIRGFPPSKKGAYLVFFLKRDEDTNQVYDDITRGYYISRLEYNPDNGRWSDRFGIIWHTSITIEAVSGDTYDLIWWDEFKITESKTIRKLKF